MNYLKKLLALLLIFFSISCSNDSEIETLLEKSENNTQTKELVLNSTEFQNYFSAFKELNALDAELFHKVKKAIKNKITTNEEFELFFIGLIDIREMSNSLIYLDKIGVKNATFFYNNRNDLFNNRIHKLTIQLGTKFPFLKKSGLSQYLETNSLNKNVLLFQNCVDNAVTTYWVNWWYEGGTYAGIVYQQTVSWCGTMYL